MQKRNMNEVVEGTSYVQTDEISEMDVHAIGKIQIEKEINSNRLS
jgi:hypothetical protein